jgi:DNA-binding NtrC family response regulator
MVKKELPTLLIIDDEQDLRTSAALLLEKDFNVATAESGPAGLKKLADQQIDVVLCDIRMADMDGLETLERIKLVNPATEVIMLTAVADAQSAVKAIKKGAYDYLVKPADQDQLKITCLRAYEKKELSTKTQVLEAELEHYRMGKMLGKSPAMQTVFRKIKKLANSEVSVLVTGETGTGKELVAQAIHFEGKRKGKPFIAINCGGIPSELLETELFGHEKGSFTSAEAAKVGKFELANGGTIFLDEIGNMPLTMQAKMLRVLQENEIERVGGTSPIPVDIRVIAATNEDLQKQIKSGKFRQDLFHRLNVVNLELPPLRDRKDDIVLLAQYFFDKYNKQYNGCFKRIGADVWEYLKQYLWPGNIRELQHLFQRIITLEEDDAILPQHLPLEIFSAKTKRGSYHSGALEELVGEYEKGLIIEALRQQDNNIQKVAEQFNIHRSTLASKIKLYGISKKDII